MLADKLDLSPSPFELRKREILRELHNADILDLTISSPMQAGLTFDITEDLQYLAKHSEWQFQAPDACGQLYLRGAIANYSNNVISEELSKILSCKTRSSSEPTDIFITASSSESYSALFKVFCEKGDCILTPNPGYPLIDTLAELADLKIHPYFLKHSAVPAEWKIDLNSLDSIPPNTKILLLIAPHNPTGHSPSKTEWNYIINFCEKHNLVLIVDEVFAAYSNRNIETQKLTDSTIPIFFLNGISKSAGLPHIKVGWICAQVPAQKEHDIYNALEFVLDSQLNCSSLSQALTARVLPKVADFQNKVRERIKINREIIANSKLQILNAVQAEIIPSQGGWYQPIYFPEQDDIELCLSLLKEKYILTNPGFLFDFPDGWLVLSLLQNPARLIKFFECI
ncbi:aminotransferase [Fibrobacterales bacterium]|nr:aminotransferase [Fibrobacterales bacterium]